MMISQYVLLNSRQLPLTLGRSSHVRRITLVGPTSLVATVGNIQISLAHSLPLRISRYAEVCST